MFQRVIALFAIIACIGASLFGQSPFSASLEIIEEGGVQLVVARFSAPEDGQLTGGFLGLELPEGSFAVLEDSPDADERGYYPGNSLFRWRVVPPVAPDEILLTFQGCVGTICYLPQEVSLSDAPSSGGGPELPSGAEPLPEGHIVAGRLEGYVDSASFLAWLDNSLDADASPQQQNLLERVFARHGWLFAGLLTILLGMLLNLTPCVLPMIPITLGILGARGVGSGRGHGFMLGAAYGGAMAFSYGVIGAWVVALGGRFGAFTSSPAFQLAIALLFVILALSMFDIISLDFSRFRRSGSDIRRGSFLTAAGLGVAAALLAGACVAPVLIWVLVLGARLYAEGNHGALWLPFLLGAGLGLPWPFLGGGMGSLPKPGPWMNYVKKAVGVIILVFAVQFAWNGWRLLAPQKEISVEADELWRTDYRQALADSMEDGKPVLLDFWGVSCKACTLMDTTTLKNSDVQRRLNEFHCVRIQGDNGVGRDLAKSFKIIGFPTYIVIMGK